MTPERMTKFLPALLALTAFWGFSPKAALAAPTVDLLYDVAFTSSSDITLAALEMPPILITNDSSTTFTAASDLRLVIPGTYSMVWDTSDTTCEILLSGTGAVTAAVSSYPVLAGSMISKVAMLDVTTNLDADTRLVITGLGVSQWSADGTGNLAVASFTFGSQTVSAGNFTLTMPTNDSSNALIRIA